MGSLFGLLQALQQIVKGLILRSARKLVEFAQRFTDCLSRLKRLLLFSGNRAVGRAEQVIVKGHRGQTFSVECQH